METSKKTSLWKEIKDSLSGAEGKNASLKDKLTILYSFAAKEELKNSPLLDIVVSKSMYFKDPNITEKKKESVFDSIVANIENSIKDQKKQSRERPCLSPITIPSALEENKLAEETISPSLGNK